MWITFIATAIAASVCFSVVNLASEINRIQEVRASAPIETSVPPDAPRLPQDQAGPIGRKVGFADPAEDEVLLDSAADGLLHVFAGDIGERA